jgi:hypothetical protein
VGLSCVLTTGTATECHSDPTCSTVKPFRRQPESWEVHSAGPPPPLRRVRRWRRACGCVRDSCIAVRRLAVVSERCASQGLAELQGLRPDVATGWAETTAATPA